MAASTPLERLVAVEKDQWDAYAQRMRDVTRIKWYVSKFGNPKPDETAGESLYRLTQQHAARKLAVECSVETEALERCSTRKADDGPAACAQFWAAFKRCATNNGVEFTRNERTQQWRASPHMMWSEVPKYYSKFHFDASKGEVDISKVPAIGMFEPKHKKGRERT